MNKNFWKLYKESEEGKRIIGLFDTSREDFYESVEDSLFEYFEKMGNSNDSSDGYFWNRFFISSSYEDQSILPDSIDFDSFMKFVEKLEINEFGYDKYDNLKKGKVIVPRDKIRDKLGVLSYLSICLYEEYGVFYFPILFPRRFDIIQRYCAVLGIDLDRIEFPNSKDYRKYVEYYWELCAVITEFQEENDLTSAEMCACLYDFAPKCIEAVSEKDDIIPLPTNVWITGAGVKNGDYEALKKMSRNSSYKTDSVWTCNERTRKGDIIIFYSTAPYSGIHFIGRAKTGGVVSPFDYYKHSTTVCDVVKLDVPISLKALKSDPYLKDVTIVRQGMRGVNGKEFSARDYQELLRLEKQLGGSIDKLPKLFETETMDFGKIKVERDVEENILIPFLMKIGYSESDWTRQLSLKAGRQEKAIPDFVFFAKGEPHFEKAPFVIEAKLDMSSCTERQNAFNQCYSYARMLSSKLMAICDKERIVVYRLNKNGVAVYTNPIFERHWASVYSDEKFGSELRKIIGRDVVVEIIG